MVEITGKTRLVGLIGWPIEHSLSPAIHNAAAADLGLDLAYLPMPVRAEDLQAALQGLAALGFLGANVTVPHKERVIPFLDRLDPAAGAIGAVNTIVINHNTPVSPNTSGESPVPPRAELTGYNTDWSGFLEDLDELDIEISNGDCLILGAGGSARAVVHALASAGGRAHVFARRREQARTLTRQLSAHVADNLLAHYEWKELADICRRVNPKLIVNTTPLGMSPNLSASPWSDEVKIPDSAFIYDLVYNPAETQFMRQAKAAGCRASNGAGTLVRQGAQAFELWTGIKPDLVVMTAVMNLML
jgi:shikimate dehydrogenase